MPAVVEQTTIDSADVSALREAFVLRTGMMNLLSEKANPTERDYEMFARKDDRYNSIWSDILERYFGGRYLTGNYRWSCDFGSGMVQITEA